MWKGTFIIWRRIKNGICHSHSATNCSSLCASVLLELCFLCPVAVRIRPKSLSSSGRFLCPVAAMYGLSRCCCPGCLQLNWRRWPYLAKGWLLKVVDSSKWWSEQQPLFWRTLHNANVIGLAKGVHGLVQCTCWQTYIYIYIYTNIAGSWIDRNYWSRFACWRLPLGNKHHMPSNLKITQIARGNRHYLFSSHLSPVTS